MTDIDDDLVLSSSTQAALAEFLAEQQAKESKVQSSPENEEDFSIDSFPEDWQVHPPPLFSFNGLKVPAVAILVR
jgi:hypothetical protein